LKLYSVRVFAHAARMPIGTLMVDSLR